MPLPHLHALPGCQERQWGTRSISQCEPFKMRQVHLLNMAIRVSQHRPIWRPGDLHMHLSCGQEVSAPLGVKKGSLCNERRQVIKLLTEAFICIENGPATKPLIAQACSLGSSSSGKHF